MIIRPRLPYRIIKNDTLQQIEEATEKMEIVVSSAKSQMEETLKKADEQSRVLEGNLKFWKQELKKQATTKKCTKCKVDINLWPFNTTIGYYIRGNRVTHQTCPTIVRKVTDVL